ncbi:centrosomal protein kizuna [Varanus komodoensis]|uniref:centrosomal protein kizuna n=1 Tax=Varanus komodoensis TaxID=61221 RepID=UPI001CF78DB5|nr:centrosomal protein kizuna [Varanus komodoensis]
MAASGYDDHLRRLQAHLRDSETKRVELERKMLDYSKSGICTTKLQYMNLKKYLKEICERQEMSLLRNQDLLREFDCFEQHIRKFASSAESLQKLKAQYETEIKSKLILEKKNLLKSEERDGIKHQMVPEARQVGINAGRAMSRGLYRAAAIFMGRQMSAVSEAEDFDVQHKSSALTKSFSISDQHSRRQASQSSYVTDSCVLQTNRDLQPSNKPDKMDGKTHLLMVPGDNLQMGKTAQKEETECSDSSSDLTVSLSEEEEEGNLLKSQQTLQKVGCKNSGNTTYKEEEHSCSQERLYDSFSDGDSSFKPAVRGCLSFEGFAHVLTFLEELVAGAASGSLALYKRKAVNEAELENLKRLCNETGSLEQKDLELCEALVLHHLQSLLQSTMNTCLLPEKAFHGRSEMLDGKQARPELTSYFAMTWERLSKHILFLQKHHVLLEQEVKDMFGTLLISERREQVGLAAPLLNASLSEECKDRSLASSDKGSRKSRPNNSKEKQEGTSWCEDESKEEGLVEKIPIAGLNIDSSGLKEQKSYTSSSEPSFSSLERSSPLSRDEVQKGVVSAIKSKAFWGDSDDSNSEIEAALRPQVQGSHEDDFCD